MARCSRESGPITVKIVGWYSSCACTRIVPPQITIPANAAAEVRLVLDLTAFVKPVGATPFPEGSGYRSEQLPGPVPKHRFSFYLRPEFAEMPNNGSQWVLGGVVRQALLAKPELLQFGESIVRGRPVKQLPVSLTPLPGTRILGVRPDPAGRFEFTLSEIGTGRAILLVTPRPTLPTGPFEIAAVIDLESDSDGRAWPFSLPIEGTVVERVRMVPEQVYLGSLRKGEASQQRLTLTCTNGNVFVAEPVTPLADGMHVEHELNSDLHVYLLTVSPRGTGQQSTSVEFRVRVGDSEPFVIAARINYYVVDPPRSY